MYNNFYTRDYALFFFVNIILLGYPIIFNVLSYRKYYSIIETD